MNIHTAICLWMNKNESREKGELKECNNVMSIVCSVFKFDRNVIVSRTRKQDVILARHAFVFICAKYKNLTHLSIAEYLNMERSTITCNLSSIKNLLKENFKGFSDHISTVKALIDIHDKD